MFKPRVKFKPPLKLFKFGHGLPDGMNWYDLVWLDLTGLV